LNHTRQNVLILTVDAFRADRVSLLGYSRPTTPTLERLARNSIVCEQAVSLSTFTQSACIQLLTSSRPLSYGGYDQGAIGRPNTLFKHLKDHGYRTTSLTSLHWVNKYYGYGPGLDEELPLFSINTFPGVVIVMLRNTLIAFDKKIIDEQTMIKKVQPILEKFFFDISDFCQWHINHEIEIRSNFSDTSLVNAGYNYPRILKLIKRHKDKFQSDLTAYVRKYLVPTSITNDWSNQWLIKEWLYMRQPGKLVEEATHRLSNKVLKYLAPDLSKARNNRYKHYVDAASLADQVISSLEKHDTKKPFCIWTHFMDTHLPYVSGRGRYWYKKTPEYLKKLGHKTSYSPAMTFDLSPQKPEDKEGFSALYDASILSTDIEISRIIDALDRLGLRENTLVAISGDHGEELGEHGNWGHYFTLYDHNTRIPMLFHHPTFKETRIKAQVSTLDFSPTISGLLGLRTDDAWKGRAVNHKDKTKSLLLMETFYGGNCMFDSRPLYFAVRSPKLLYLWKEYRDPEDKYSPDGPELYDHTSDPDQLNNIYNDDHPELPKFNQLIAERMAEISEITDQRIIDAFGQIGQKVIKQNRPKKKKI